MIVGAPKAGTTALYYYLKQHPDIGLSEPKETKYFTNRNIKLSLKGTGDDIIYKYSIKTFEAYKALFKPIAHKKCIGEASVDYMFYHDKTALDIRETIGDIKIIVVIRDPVKRAFSNYNNMIRDSRETLSFRGGLDKEEERMNKNWDFMWGYKKGGLYYEQIKTFQSCFSNVKVIIQEDLKNRTHETLQEIFRFLDINEKEKINTEIEYNPSGKPNNIFAKFLLRRDNMFSDYLREGTKKIFPRGVLERVSSSMISKKLILEKDEKYLRSYFKEDIEKLEQLLNKDLSIWKK